MNYCPFAFLLFTKHNTPRAFSCVLKHPHQAKDIRCQLGHFVPVPASGEQKCVGSTSTSLIYWMFWLFPATNFHENCKSFALLRLLPVYQIWLECTQCWQGEEENAKTFSDQNSNGMVLFYVYCLWKSNVPCVNHPAKNMVFEYNLLFKSRL